MANCLVTGHKGYIGSKVYEELKRLGHNVIGIDLNDDPSRDIITCLKEDTDGKFYPFYWNFQPEYIFHLACWPRVLYCMENPVETAQNNILAGSIILNFAKKCKSVKRVIYSSSSSVVGNGGGPTNPYALHKFTTELECKIYSEIYNLDTVSLRYFNVYSADQPANGPYATAIANWRRTIKDGRTPFITGDGEQRRDMVHVEDVVSANIFAMNYPDSFRGRNFDVGTGDNISLNEAKEIVNRHHQIEFDYIAPRSGEITMTRANTQPLADLGWKAKISIKNGIDECFNFEGEK